MTPASFRRALALVVLPAALTGLLAAPAAAQPAAAEPRVVVAVIDSGVNAYHDIWHGDPSPSVTPSVLAELGIDAAHTITLTRTGNFAADFSADAAQFAAVRPGEPYWFAGTNLVGISFDGSTTDNNAATRPILPDNAGDTHGFSVSSAVARANPEAVVVFVEGTAEAAGEAWAFGHPAVDIITTSYGVPGSIPVFPELKGSYAGVLQRGKLHFGACDNSPAPSTGDSTCGPPWSIGVSGFHEDSSRGREALSGTLPDFVGDFTQSLPECFNCESGSDGPQSGTSFATPRAAGTASKILLDARRAAGHTGGILPTATLPDAEADGAPVVVRGAGRSVTTWQFRRALELAARYPTLAEYDAAGLLDDLTTIPVVDGAVLTGWGLISPTPMDGVVTEALARLGYGGTPARGTDKDAPTDQPCRVNAANHAVRFEYWTTNLQSEASGTTHDPYLPCGAATSSAFAQGPGDPEPDPVIPEAPAAPLLVLAGLAAGAVALRGRRRAAA